MQWRPGHYSRNKSKALPWAIGTVGLRPSTETPSGEPQCQQCHVKGKLTLPLHKLLKLQAGMQDRKGLPCTWGNPFRLVIKPPYKIFHSCSSAALVSASAGWEPPHQMPVRIYSSQPSAHVPTLPFAQLWHSPIVSNPHETALPFLRLHYVILNKQCSPLRDPEIWDLPFSGSS